MYLLTDIHVLLCHLTSSATSSIQVKLYKTESASNNRYVVFPVTENALERILHEGQ
jgi:hypothetical protein